MKRKSNVSDWFCRRRLGLFIHWGLYAIPAWHEQLQWRGGVPRREYETLIKKFNPEKFDPAKWLDLAEEAGMEYIVFTTKHHDGFCMWDTSQTDFNVMNSPYKKDILKLLAEECARRKFPLFLYYSVVDWHHPNYPNCGRSHELPGPEEGDEPDLGEYIDFLKAQVRELCTGYGEIRGFWWDMNRTEHEDPSINGMIRSLQPKAVINDRGFDEGDFGTPERETKKTEGIPRFDRPTEACNSVGTQSWGYKKDEDYYSLRHLIGSIDSIMARGGNFLLNAGPEADGTIPYSSEKIIKNIGRWYNSVKESFSAEPAPDLRKTFLKTDASLPDELIQDPAILTGIKGRECYIHLNSFPRSEAVILKPVVEVPRKAVLLNTGKEIPFGLDYLPSLWKTGKKHLRLRKIPVNKLCGEVPVIKLSFDD